MSVAAKTGKVIFAFVDGKFSAAHSSLQELPAGIEYATGNDADSDSIFSLRISANTCISRPVHFMYLQQGGQKIAEEISHFITIGENGQLVLIDEFVSSVPGLVKEFVIENNAGLDYVSFQPFSKREKTQTVAKSTLHFVQKSHSRVSAGFFARGGISEECIRVQQEGIGAESNFYGFYAGKEDGESKLHDIQITHAASSGTGSMLYKSILDNKSVSGFRGRVFVGKGVCGISATQATHALLLSSGAEAYSRPELEIHAEDVKCSHGATVGQLDADALFYLCSRGIAMQEAKKMLLQSFAAEVFDRLPSVVVRAMPDVCTRYIDAEPAE